jgi:hypothetical protein
MGNWLLNLPVLWMGAFILGATYLFTAGLYLLITTLAVDDRGRSFKAISPGILPPLAIIFALLVGFLAVQDWNDTERANTAVTREASALRAVVLLAGEFPGEPETRLRHLIRTYIQDAVTREWPAMARQDATLAIAPPGLAAALRLTLSLAPQREGQVIAQREMVAAIENALDARRQRIILSSSSINWVKMDRPARAGRSHPDHDRDGAQRQPPRRPHHPGDLHHRRRGSDRTDRVPQPAVQRRDLGGPRVPAPGHAGGGPGGHPSLRKDVV